MTPQEEAEKAKSAIETTEAPEPLPEIPFDLVTKHDRKSTRLLSNSNAVEAIHGRHKKIDFDFHEDIFVIKIIIDTKGYLSSNFEIGWVTHDGTSQAGSVQRSGDQFICKIAAHCRSIYFIPPKTLITDPMINWVRVYGFKSKEISEFLDYVLDVDRIAENAVAKIDKSLREIDAKIAHMEALQALRGTLTQDIASLKSRISNEQGKLKKLGSQYNEQITRKGEIERGIEDENSRLDLLRGVIRRNMAVRNELAENIAKKRSTLSDLESNINLFPSEISGFSNQGAADVNLYTALAAVPIAVIVLILLTLVFGAAKLSTEINYKWDLNIPALIASRAPYVIICLSIITTCYYLSRTFVL